MGFGVVTGDVAAVGRRAEAGLLVVVVGKHDIFGFWWGFHEDGRNGKGIYWVLKLKGVDCLMGIAR